MLDSRNTVETKEKRSESLNWEHKKWVIKPVMEALLIFLIASLFLILIDGYLIFKLVGLGNYAEWVLLKSRWIILGGFLVEAGLFLILAFVIALKVAHKIISPIERIEREADLLFDAPYLKDFQIKVRDGDPLQKLVEKINLYVRSKKNGTIN